MGDWFVGEIRLFSMSWNPEYWLPCDGRMLQIQSNAALYSLLGTTFGGNGSTTFALPDLRGRTPVGTSTTSQTYQRGVAGGTENVVLLPSQVAIHTHNFRGASAVGTAAAMAVGSYIGSVAANPPTFPTAPNAYTPQTASTQMVALNPGTLSMAGASAGHSNMQPSLVLNFCIAQAGTYPPRN